MFNQKSVIKHVSDFAEEIKNSGIHLRKIVLYGSYASNRQHEWSDIDVALVADEFSGFGFEDVGIIAVHMRKYPYYLIQPRTYNTKNFSAKQDPFVDEILKTGIEIKL